MNLNWKPWAYGAGIVVGIIVLMRVLGKAKNAANPTPTATPATASGGLPTAAPANAGGVV